MGSNPTPSAMQACNVAVAGLLLFCDVGMIPDCDDPSLGGVLVAAGNMPCDNYTFLTSASDGSL